MPEGEGYARIIFSEISGSRSAFLDYMAPNDFENNYRRFQERNINDVYTAMKEMSEAVKSEGIEHFYAIYNSMRRIFFMDRKTETVVIDDPQYAFPHKTTWAFNGKHMCIDLLSFDKCAHQI